jgi:hypothetical protein
MARLLTHHKLVLPLARLIEETRVVIDVEGDIVGVLEADAVVGVLETDLEVIGVLEEFEVSA